MGKDRDLRTAIRPILRGLNTPPDCTAVPQLEPHECRRHHIVAFLTPGALLCGAARGFIESITEMCRILGEGGLGFVYF